MHAHIQVTRFRRCSILLVRILWIRHANSDVPRYGFGFCCCWRLFNTTSEEFSRTRACVLQDFVDVPYY